MVELSREEFEDAVGDALDSIPADLLEHIDNCVILVEEEPPPDQLPDTLGLYDGTPLTERDSWWATGSLPDRIFIFRGPLSRMCTSREELLEEIRITVIHEVGHHFGVDDDRLHELGWG